MKCMNSTWFDYFQHDVSEFPDSALSPFWVVLEVAQKCAIYKEHVLGEVLECLDRLSTSCLHVAHVSTKTSYT